MTQTQLVGQIAGDLLDACSWTVEDYGEDAEALAQDLVSEHSADLRHLGDDGLSFLTYTVAERVQ